MTASVAQSSEQTDAALAAFLRGIERRGMVLAEAQCADHVRAQTAIIASKIAFRERAQSQPMAQWPSLYWQLLLAQPALRVAMASGSGDALARLNAGQRAALLLRLVAGLDPAHCAEALQVSPAVYQQALYRALESLRAHGIDEAKLRGMRDRLQEQITYQAQSNRHTETVSIEKTGEPEPTANDPTAADRAAGASRWIRLAPRVLLALLVVVLVATFFWQPPFLRSRTASAHGFESLRAQAPAETLSPATIALSSADFDLLNDPQGERIARDMDLYAWYAANSNADATSPHSTTTLPETTAPETSAPDADAAESSGAQ